MNGPMAVFAHTEPLSAGAPIGLWPTRRSLNFGGKPANDGYANKCSKMWDATAKWLRDGGCLPNYPELKTDLYTPTYSFNAAGKAGA